ncbi:MAG: PHP domain-containing protein [Bacteroidales bacterium]|nr:PHP domain-containing protein [Bacteroidales bacterium]MBN2772636.1 PHP domain-containing protein [Prolixibacteraceae bacterium]
MDFFRADLHIHTVLSPCASLEMSPGRIVEEAVNKQIDIIGITDHNSTKHCELVKKLGYKKGLFVLSGVEITTREEVHCLAFFEDIDSLSEMQKFIDRYLPVIQNDVNRFGYQVIVDEHENILEIEERLLIVALNSGIKKIEEKVHELNGIFIPAHVDRFSNGIFSQLGFIPPDLNFEALGITRNASVDSVRERFNIQEEIALIKNSDAHQPEIIGSGFSEFFIEEISFSEIKMALGKKRGRYVRIL